MSLLTLELAQPTEEDVTAADTALEYFANFLAHHPKGPENVRVHVDDEQDEVVIPRMAIELVAKVLAHLAAGHGVSVVPLPAELTTQQAADLLNVSRPYLIGLLESGKIEYRKVGKHRRVDAASLFRYLKVRREQQRQAADELTALGQEMGLI